MRQWQTADANKQTGKKGRALDPGKAVFKLAYHPDPDHPLLATCGADATVRLYNAKTGAAVKTLAGFNDYVFAVALSPDGQLVAGGSNKGEVRIWKTGDGTLVKAFIGSPGFVQK